MMLTLLHKFFHEMLGSGVAPSRGDSLSHRRFADTLEMDGCGAAAAPGAFRRHEDFGIVLREIVLLLGSELNHPPTFGGVAERGENLTVHAKIRMIHVGVLCRFRKSQGHAAKVIGGHTGVLPCALRRGCLYASITAGEARRLRSLRC